MKDRNPLFFLMPRVYKLPFSNSINFTNPH